MMRNTSVEIVAHMGIPADYPENTIPSLAAAAKLPVYGVEFDVHLTADGKLVVTHDDTVERCSNGQGRIRNMTLRELRKLDFGGWKAAEFAGTPIPTLAEAVDAILSVAPGRRMLIEVKEDDPACAKAVLDFVERRGIVGQAMLTSFSAAILRLLRREGPPELKLHGSDSGDNLREEEGRRLIDSVGIHFPLVTAERVEAYHRRGIRVDAWVIDSLAELRRARACGADGITTNAADRIIRELENEGIPA